MGPDAPDGARVHIAGKPTMESSGLGEAMQEAQVPEPAITEFEVTPSTGSTKAGQSHELALPSTFRQMMRASM